MANEYTFETFGPFLLERSTEQDPKTSFKSLLASIQVEEGLAEAIGVYVVAQRTVDGVLSPVYVGKTDSGFLNRLKQHRKGLLAKDPDASQLPDFSLFLIARVSPKTRKFVKPKASGKTHNSIDHVEDLLIGACLSLNPKLRNEKKKLFLSGFDIPGFTTSSTEVLTGSANRLKAMLHGARDPVRR